MSSNCFKKDSKSLASRETQIKTMLRPHITPFRESSNKKSDDKFWTECGERDTYSWQMNTFWELLKNFRIDLPCETVVYS